MASTSTDLLLQVTVVSPDGKMVLRRRYDAATTFSIGRGEDCDILLREFGKKISRCHAVVLHDGVNWEFYNLGVNGSYENGKQIESIELTASNVVRLGKRGPIVQFKVVEASAQARLPETDNSRRRVRHDDKTVALFDDDTERDRRRGSSATHDESTDDSVTRLVGRIRDGDEASAQELWDRYFDEIVDVARASLKDVALRVHDEEDVAIVAFRSLLAGITSGRFQGLDHREQLWRLLMVITTRKAAAIIDREQRQKRGSGEVRGDSAIAAPDDSDLEPTSPGFDRLHSEKPTPDIAAVVADETRQLIASLDDAASQQIAVLKMEGYTHEEISTKLGCATRTVERRVREIRERWQRLADDAK